MASSSRYIVSLFMVSRSSHHTLLHQGWLFNLEKPEKLLFGLFSLLASNSVHVGSLVAPGELNRLSRNRLGRTLFCPLTSPVETFTITEYGNRLFLLVATIGVRLVRFQPLCPLGSPDVAIVLCYCEEVGRRNFRRSKAR